MTSDVHILYRCIQTCLFVASVGSTLVPIIYAFSPWHRSALGRAFMAQAVAFAATLDLTVVYSVWRPANVYIRFWTEIFAFALIAYTTARIAWYIWDSNYRKR